MTIDVNKLAQTIYLVCPDLPKPKIISNQLVLKITASQWLATAKILRDDVRVQFNQLIDICGVDYQSYGATEWDVRPTQGFSRGVGANLRREEIVSLAKGRFLVVAQLLSTIHKYRLRVHIDPAGDEPPTVPSVCSIWSSANWFEREAFDLFGIVFSGHPDLRRILTDYGFVGHPFRKDFPLVGKVELLYDQEHKKCVYQPCSIEMRTTVPRVIRPQIISPTKEQGD